MARSQGTAAGRLALPPASTDRSLHRRFFCPAKRLIIELDGGHHNEDATAARDLVRQRWLEHEGYRVIRFWNSEIASDLTAVMERIYVELYGSREAGAIHLEQRRKRKTST